MVADDGVVMIGAPNPSSEEPCHSIAAIIVSRPFALSVRESLETIWKAA
jgi:hypothetical protein